MDKTASCFLVCGIVLVHHPCVMHAAYSKVLHDEARLEIMPLGSQVYAEMQGVKCRKCCV